MKEEKTKKERKKQDTETLYVSHTKKTTTNKQTEIKQRRNPTIFYCKYLIRQPQTVIYKY